MAVKASSGADFGVGYPSPCWATPASIVAAIPRTSILKVQYSYEEAQKRRHTNAGRVSQSSTPSFPFCAFLVQKRAATTATHTGGQIAPAVKSNGGLIWREAILKMDKECRSESSLWGSKDERDSSKSWSGVLPREMVAEILPSIYRSVVRS